MKCFNTTCCMYNIELVLLIVDINKHVHMQGKVLTKPTLLHMIKSHSIMLH